MAPGMLPSPPMTAAMSPFTVTGTVRSGERIPTEAPTIAPAIAADDPRDDERGRVRALHAHAAELGRDRLLGDRPGRHAELGPIEDVEQEGRREHAQAEDEQQVAPHPEVAPTPA